MGVAQLSTALPTLAEQLHSDDEQVLSDVCWCFSYLSDDDSEQGAFIKGVINSGICERLVDLLSYVLLPSLPSPSTTKDLFFSLPFPKPNKQQTDTATTAFRRRPCDPLGTSSQGMMPIRRRFLTTALFRPFWIFCHTGTRPSARRQPGRYPTSPLDHRIISRRLLTRKSFPYSCQWP